MRSPMEAPERPHDFAVGNPTWHPHIKLKPECPEPHHAHQHDEKAHRKHHWKERAVCLSICTTLHVVLEVISHYWK